MDRRRDRYLLPRHFAGSQGELRIVDLEAQVAVRISQVKAKVHERVAVIGYLSKSRCTPSNIDRRSAYAQIRVEEGRDGDRDFGDRALVRIHFRSRHNTDDIVAGRQLGGSSRLDHQGGRAFAAGEERDLTRDDGQPRAFRPDDA